MVWLQWLWLQRLKGDRCVDLGDEEANGQAQPQGTGPMTAAQGREG